MQNRLVLIVNIAEGELRMRISILRDARVRWPAGSTCTNNNRLGPPSLLST